MADVVVYPTAGMVRMSTSAISPPDESIAVPEVGTTGPPEHQLDSDDGDTTYIESQPGVSGGVLDWNVPFGMGMSSAVPIGGNLVGSGNPLPGNARPAQAYIRVIARATAGAPAYFLTEILPATTTVGFPDTLLAEAVVASAGYTEIRVPFPTCPTDIDESGFASLYRIRLWPRVNGDRGSNWMRATLLSVVIPAGDAPVRQYPRDDGLVGTSRVRQYPKPASRQGSIRQAPAGYR